MSRVMSFLIPLMFIVVIVLLIYGFKTIKNRKKPNKVISFIILGVGVLLDVGTTILIVKQEESNRICALNPECMNESGLLYVLFGFLLILGTIILFTGLVNVTKAYRAKD